MKSIKFICISVYLLLVFVLLSGCVSSPAAPTPDIGLYVAQTQTAASLDQLLIAVTETSRIQISATPPEPQSTVTLAAAPPTPDCMDKAEYVSETIPDGTKFAPGESFEKQWVFRNAGSCSWTADYKLVFFNGEQMGGPTEIPIGTTVAPGNILEIALTLIAPSEQGPHKGFWKLQNEQGHQFGLGDTADVAFWVQIETVEKISNLSLGEPDWVDNFDNNQNSWFLGADENTNFEIQNGRMTMTAINPTGDQWRIGGGGYAGNFIIEAEFNVGESCSGKDSYGLLIRAPDQADSVIDSGYIIMVSCDGHYRAYLMQEGQYNGLINWTSDNAIRTGSQQQNILSIEANDVTLKIYINGIQVNEFSDAAYSTGYYGLAIRSDGTNNFIVHVDKLSFWSLP